MSQPGRVHRSGIAAVVLVLGVAFLLGASLAVGLQLAEERTPPAPADRVPADVDYVGYAEPATARSEPTLRNATLFSLRFQSATVFYSGPDFVDSYAFGRQGGPNPDGIEWVVYYGRSNGSAYAARILRTNWTTDTLVTAIERDRNVSLTEREYRDRTLYTGGNRAAAVLSDGTFAVGNVTAVRDAVDVHVGASESVSGPLRSRFERENGFIRFAYRFRPDTVPASIPFVDDSIRRVEYVGASYTLNGSNVVVTANTTVAQPEDADAVAGILTAGISFYRFETENASIRAELDKIHVSRDGRVVRVRYESAPANYRPFLRTLYRNQPVR